MGARASCLASTLLAAGGSQRSNLPWLIENDYARSAGVMGPWDVHGVDLTDMVASRRLWIVSRATGQISTVLLLAFSVISSSMLLILCTRRLMQREFRSNAAVLQVLLIAILDIAQGLWSSIPVFVGKQPESDGPRYCPLFMKVRSWLFTASALMSAVMVLGVFLALLGKPRLRRWQRYSPLGALVLTFVLQPNFFESATFLKDTEGCDFPSNVGCCAAHDRSELYVGIELAAVLLFVFSVQVYLLFRIRSTFPGSVVSRIIWSASGYIAACCASYFGLAVTFIAEGVDKDYHTDALDWVFFMSWRFMLANGFFNFMAMMYHGRMLLFRARTASDLQERNVMLSATPETVTIDRTSMEEVICHISEQIDGFRSQGDLPDPLNRQWWPYDTHPADDAPARSRVEEIVSPDLGHEGPSAEGLIAAGFVDENLLLSQLAALSYSGSILSTSGTADHGTSGTSASSGTEAVRWGAENIESGLRVSATYRAADEECERPQRELEIATSQLNALTDRADAAGHAHRQSEAASGAADPLRSSGASGGSAELGLGPLDVVPWDTWGSITPHDAPLEQVWSDIGFVHERLLSRTHSREINAAGHSSGTSTESSGRRRRLLSSQPREPEPAAETAGRRPEVSLAYLASGPMDLAPY